MKLFLTNLFIFLLLLMGLCAGMEFMIDEGLRKSKYQNFSEWNDIYDSKLNADLIIQGSSRAWTQFSPRTIDSVLNFNSYNIGLDGYGFIMQYYRLKCYLEHNQNPKYIIQSLDVFSLRRPRGLFQGYQFLPYLDDSLIQKAVGHYDDISPLSIYMPLLKYNNYPKAASVGLSTFLLQRNDNNGKYKGFKSRNKIWNDSFDSLRAIYPQGLSFEQDSLSIALFDEFLGYCSANHIKVVLVYSPEYIESQRLVKNRENIFDL